MFAKTKAFSGFSTNDIAVTQRFYADVLEVEVTEENGMLTLHLAGGDRPTLVYPKDDHVPATFTILNFPVEDIDDAAESLRSKGIEIDRPSGMEDYLDGQGIMRGKTHDMGPNIAWFKDPTGNVLSIIEL